VASLGEFLVTEISETGTGSFQPQVQVDTDGSGNAINRDHQPFGGADVIAYEIEFDSTGTVEIRGGSSKRVAPTVLRSETANVVQFIGGPLPYLDFNITANGSGIKIRCWGNKSSS